MGEENTRPKLFCRGESLLPPSQFKRSVPICTHTVPVSGPQAHLHVALAVYDVEVFVQSFRRCPCISLYAPQLRGGVYIWGVMREGTIPVIM